MIGLTTTTIDICVQSRYPEVLKRFKESFYETTKNWGNLTLYEITGKDYGAKEINKILRSIVARKNGGIFGVYNDDLVFSEGWLDDVVNALGDYEAVSPGYVETKDYQVFQKAVEATKNDDGVIDLLYGPIHTFRVDIFEKVGIFDERFDWSVDDLDWAWRLRLNGMRSVTLKKITVQHLFHETLGRDLKGWNSLHKKNKEFFYDKHGYRSYRTIRNLYEGHKYFRSFL